MPTDAPTISKSPEVCGGSACVRDTRIPVWMLQRLKDWGRTDEELLKTFPTLLPADLPTVWEYVRQNQAEITDANAKNDCRLRHPSSYYASQFRPEDIIIAPYRAAGQYVLTDDRGFVPADSSARPGKVWGLGEQREHGWVEINRDGPEFFTVVFPCTNGSVADKHVELARKVLNKIAEMDADARQVSRSTPGGDDYEETLSEVEIASDTVRFHYAANVCNTSWCIRFKVMEDGSLGIPSW